MIEIPVSHYPLPIAMYNMYVATYKHKQPGNNALKFEINTYIHTELYSNFNEKSEWVPSL